jgi:hypothetical protein
MMMELWRVGRRRWRRRASVDRVSFFFFAWDHEYGF